ncbi:spore germination lipoprotein GerD [Ureibacillus thermosphaericus]|uniref:spore germination lipoprotein GerD n=1 Tax=Ureibacillus thermosphaericus TaxID=51173 RepID=UPI000BBC4D57|nr:spore germination lipoprotein GerD [Ureibacillus thermosphaericus]
MKNPLFNRLLILFFILILLASCSDSPNAQPSYEEVKKIVVDAIQTEDGKKAIRQLLEDPSFRELVILEHDEVETSINNSLLSEQAQEFWKKTFEDPKFKESMAKSMKEQQTEIMKQLIKDASFQEDLIAFFGQPEMKKELESILKSAELRKEIEKVVMETIENPLLQTKWQELIKKNGESGGSKEKGKESSSGGQDEQGQDQGGSS